MTVAEPAIQSTISTKAGVKTSSKVKAKSEIDSVVIGAYLNDVQAIDLINHNYMVDDPDGLANQIVTLGQFIIGIARPGEVHKRPTALLVAATNDAELANAQESSDPRSASAADPRRHKSRAFVMYPQKAESGSSGLQFASSKPACRAVISMEQGSPLWEGCDAQAVEGVAVEPDWDLATQPAPDYEADQRINW